MRPGEIIPADESHEGPERVIILEDPRRLAQKGAEIFVARAKGHAIDNGRFVVAISGGSTPRPMHRLLAKDPYLKEIPWDRTHLFWVDERCVPEDHPASNYGAAKRDFIDRVPIPGEHVHQMPGDIPPEKGAIRYEETLKSFFRLGSGQLPVFDLILLGTGNDGHTASLFPGQDPFDNLEKLVAAVRGGDPFVDRLTLTYPVLNHGREIVFMVSGEGKSGIMKTILEGNEAPLPSQRVKPQNGGITWLLDREAASLLAGDISYDVYRE